MANRTAEAIPFFRKALELNPKDKNVRLNLAAAESKMAARQGRNQTASP